jgi:hypothetical protein
MEGVSLLAIRLLMSIIIIYRCIALTAEYIKDEAKWISLYGGGGSKEDH